MAIAPLIVSIRTFGAAQLTRLGTAFRRLGAQIRTSWGRMTSSLIAHGGILGVLGRMAAPLGRMGATMGRGLARGFSAGVNQIQSIAAAIPDAIKPALIGGLIALSPAIGAALNGAILAAVGGGVMAAGIVAAIKRNPALGKAFSGVFSRIGEDAKEFSRTFDAPLLASAQAFGNTWSKVSGSVSRMFATMAKAVEPLARGLGGLVERMMPGLESAIKGAAPVFRELANSLPGLGKAIGDMFRSFGEGGEGAARGLRIFIGWLGGVLIATGNVVEFLAKGFQKITDAAERFANKLAALPLIGEKFRGLADGMAEVNGSVQGVARPMASAMVASDSTAAAFQRTADAARRAGDEAVAMSNKMNSLVNANMSATQAQIAYEAAIDQVSASFRENGKTLDVANAKGRENVQTVLQAVAAAEQKRQASIALAGGEKASADAVAAANSAFNAQLDQLAAVLRQAGLTEAEVNTLLGTYRSLANQNDIYKTITVERKLLGPQLGGVFGYRGLATGTTSAPRGAAIVGEEGPELVTFRGGERVYNATETARLLGNRSGGSGALAAGAMSAPPIRIMVAPGASGVGNPFANAILEMLRTGQLRLNVVNGRVMAA